MVFIFSGHCCYDMANAEIKQRLIMKKIFFIGAGKMATAIAGGLVSSGTFSPDELGTFDPAAPAIDNFIKTTGINNVYRDAADGIADSESILIAVKPQSVKTALFSHRNLLKDKLIISIAAGITISQLQEITGSRRIIRVMPNTPALVKKGASAYACSSDIDQDSEQLAEKILSSVGIVIKLQEKDLDAVTALSGSGPAYAFEFIQAMADGGVAEGLSRETAQLLAAQTLAGAAEMVLQTGEHPTVLKDKVTSPAGTTSRALEVLAADGVAGSIIKAVRAAAARSKELGKN